MISILQGDNLPLLAAMADASFDLIYVDPPYNTGKTQKRTGQLICLDAFFTTWEQLPSCEVPPDLRRREPYFSCVKVVGVRREWLGDVTGEAVTWRICGGLHDCFGSRVEP